jgi:hypothetical protein
MDQRERAVIVWLILNGRTDEALNRLAEGFGTTTPRVKVGLPKGRKKQTLGCYEAESRTIRLLDSNRLTDPFVVLHEFYHHLRTDVSERHRGTEKYANSFANEFIDAFRKAQRGTMASSTEGKD